MNQKETVKIDGALLKEDLRQLGFVSKQLQENRFLKNLLGCARSTFDKYIYKCEIPKDIFDRLCNLFELNKERYIVKKEKNSYVATQEAFGNKVFDISNDNAIGFDEPQAEMVAIIYYLPMRKPYRKTYPVAIAAYHDISEARLIYDRLKNEIFMYRDCGLDTPLIDSMGLHPDDIFTFNYICSEYVD